MDTSGPSTRRRVDVAVRAGPSSGSAGRDRISLPAGLNMPDARAVARLVEEAHRRHWATVLATTVRLTRDLDLAEDCTQDAYVHALRNWPDVVPDNPSAG